MRILLLAVGSQGDVRPFAAVGRGLARLGHDVVLATHEAFRETARQAGIGFSLIRANPMDIVQGETGQAWLTSMDNPLQFLRTTSRIAGDVLDAINDDAWAASEGSDALLYSLPLSLSGQSIAAARGIPGIPAALYPLHPSRAFPSIMTPKMPRLGGLGNWLSAALVINGFWLMFRTHQNRWRQTRQGLPALPRRAPLGAWKREGVPMIYGFSPSVIPVPSDWSAGCVVCGYWFLESGQGWTPPKGLADFMVQGPPPLYVGFGSMASEKPEQMTGMVLEALRRTGQRAILASGWGGLRGSALPSTVHAVDFVPHDWLFPRVAGAIHHGGAGTTAAALRAGVPSFIVPFFADQFFWGNRLHAMGLSPAPVAHRALSVDALAAAMETMVSSRDMRSRCGATSKAIEAEHGVENAAAAVDRYLASVIRQRIH
jgi:UDP:flavonoid glycosyltransferase YjiC (YdhE family)